MNKFDGIVKEKLRESYTRKKNMHTEQAKQTQFAAYMIRHVYDEKDNAHKATTSPGEAWEIHNKRYYRCEQGEHAHLEQLQALARQT